MTENVVRFADYERRSREADAVPVRNPADADVIVLGEVRQRREETNLPVVIAAQWL